MSLGNGRLDYSATCLMQERGYRLWRIAIKEFMCFPIPALKGNEP